MRKTLIVNDFARLIVIKAGVSLLSASPSRRHFTKTYTTSKLFATLKQTLYLALLFVALLSFGCGGSKSTTYSGSKKPKSSTSGKGKGVTFITSGSLQPVLQRAKAENKLVFLDFYTTWCLPCRVMDEEVFGRSNTARMVDKNFISYKINAEKDNGPNLATIFEVYAYPTLLFLDADGNVLERKDGSLSNTQFLNMAESALLQGK